MFNVAAYKPETLDATQQQRLVLYSAPGADNDNLRAQRGLVMLYSQKLASGDAKFDPLPYDQVLLLDQPNAKNRPLMFKVIAPASGAASILFNLAASGVAAGALFPGLWGVARELEEQKDFPPSSRRIVRTQTAEAIFEQMIKAWETTAPNS